MRWWSRAFKIDFERVRDDLLHAQVGDYTHLRRHQDFRAVFGSEQGKRVLWQILDWSGIYRTTIGKDRNETYFNEGQRALGLSILRTIHMEPAGAITVQREERDE